MIDNVKKIIDNKDSKIGFLFLFVLYFVTCIILYEKGHYSFKDEEQYIWGNIVIIIIQTLFFISFFVWLIRTNYLIGSFRKENGIVFFISTDDLEKYNYVRNGFLSTLRKFIDETEDLEMEVVPFLRTKDSKYFKDSCKDVLQKTDGCLGIEIKVDNGKIDGSLVYSLKTEFKTHSKFEESYHSFVKKELSKMIKEYFIYEESSYEAKKEISNELVIIIKYIILVLNLLSSDEKIFLDAHQYIKERLDNYNGESEILKEIYERLPVVTEELLVRQFNSYYTSYLDNGGNRNLRIAQEYLERMKTNDPDSYRYNISMANITFYKTRDIDKAREYTVRAMHLDSKGVEWKYSEAFLLAYEGRVLTAYRKYKKILSKHDYHSITEIEDYISKIYGLELEKYQLLFYLGLINEIYKKDYKLAKEYFEDFLREEESAGNFPQLELLAQDYIESERIA